VKKRPDRSSVSTFDPDRFIQGATAEQRPAASPGSNLPAQGFVRRTFDLREDLARRLKITAAEQDRPMREILEEALVSYLGL
jgi:hypothetical protein